jgi:hypothetical protein
MPVLMSRESDRVKVYKNSNKFPLERKRNIPENCGGPKTLVVYNG